VQTQPFQFMVPYIYTHTHTYTHTHQEIHLTHNCDLKIILKSSSITLSFTGTYILLQYVLLRFRESEFTINHSVIMLKTELSLRPKPFTLASAIKMLVSSANNNGTAELLIIYL
jgi:hypothetical protein